MDTEGKERVGRIQRVVYIYMCVCVCTLLCVKYTACGKLLYSTGSSAQHSVMTNRVMIYMGVEEKLQREGI